MPDHHADDTTPLLPKSPSGSSGGSKKSDKIGNSSQAPTAANGTDAPKQAPPADGGAVAEDPTEQSTWGPPAGLGIRRDNDENLTIFRQAIGINVHRLKGSGRGADSDTLEEGRGEAVGIYRSVIRRQSSLRFQHGLLQAFLYLMYFAQIIIGASLTALGAAASRYEKLITVLGAFNTVIAGILALIKGSGQPGRLGKDRIGFRRLQDWIEETDALLAVGVLGRNQKEVGLLVETAFRRYNSAKTSEENNDPDYYVSHPNAPGAPANWDEDGAPNGTPAIAGLATPAAK